MENTTATQILDTAQAFVRNRGYSAFSYADIAEQVGIRKASIHYHFPTKDELVRQLVRRYRENLGRACDRIASSGQSPQQQIEAFADLYRQGLSEGQICLCGMLSADFAVLPTPVQEEIQLFFRQMEIWLTDRLRQRVPSSIPPDPQVESEARRLIALLSGAQLLARTCPDPDRAFDALVLPAVAVPFAQSIDDRV